ncbi:hypothetical protein CHS0354_038164 [Potamilus streckersoni]|uniref:Triple QxxK/R motif-containing protein n=1 Tax=Potamilus streckersoni TaxID=2493646 RepID=A0AAE0T0N1_9BIVA|nr:hypothetical protein CHS0354_038164 [Potamilus streckersoni]
MGKKDATGVRSTPVEQYRKQIGKQDWKKSKKEVKASKSHAQIKKTASGMQDVLLIVGTCLTLVIGLYFMMYWYLNKENLVSAPMDEEY